MTEQNKTKWICPACGSENLGKFCTQCGTIMPEITQPEAINIPELDEAISKASPAEPVQKTETVHTEPVQEVKTEPVHKAEPVQPVKTAKNTVKKSNYHPVLITLLALVLGFAAGMGGGIFAVKRYAKDLIQTAPETEPAETEPQEQETAPAAAPAAASAVDTSSVIQDVAAEAVMTVVEIQTENTTTNYGLFGGTYTSTAAGSGVIISEDGYIITNNHVVEGSQKITVTTYDGSSYDAQLIGTDSKSDIAVIKIDATGLTAAKIGDSDKLNVGDPAIVVGNPLGTLGGTITSGIISATNRDIVINNQAMNLIQTDAAINSGNSGGGLFNENGELVGIVNAKDSGMTSSGTIIEGLGFAIPINTAYEVATELIENGYVTSRPTIGVALSTLDADQGPYKAGLYITTVYEGSGAEKAGLQEYDRIVSVEGTEVSTYTELSKILTEKKVGDTLKMQIEREGKMIDVEITLTGPLDSMMTNS